MIHLDMGKYAPFVWPVYAISAAVLIWMVIDSLARARRWRREAERLGPGKDRA
jgi:heme exporter protein CcmD